MKNLLWLILLLAGLSAAQAENISMAKVQNLNRYEINAKFLPGNNKVLLILGQDLYSLSEYVDSGYFPEPAGVTTYLAFYSLLNSSFPAFGALGQDINGDSADNVDWGAGPVNAWKTATLFTQSSIAIGLNIAEGSGNYLWAKGGLADIGVGAYDDHIRHLAKFCKSINNSIFLRIGYEFDGSWNSGYEKKTSYILAFRRIVDVMREEGVSNVAYVWQASASPIDDLIDGHHENIANWYPGNDYVDWIGMSWFLPPDVRINNAPSQRDLADEVLNFARNNRKPAMIAEASPQGYDLMELTNANISPLWDGEAGKNVQHKTPLEIWQEWFVPFFDYIHTNNDVVRAVAYINADWDGQLKWSAPYSEGYWGDSRVQMNSVIRKLWLQQTGDYSFWSTGN